MRDAEGEKEGGGEGCRRREGVKDTEGGCERHRRRGGEEHRRREKVRDAEGGRR